MFSECSLPLAWMVIFLVAVPMAMVSSSQSSALLFCRGLLMSVPSNQMMGSGWSFVSVVMRVFCSFVWNEMRGGAESAPPRGWRGLQSWPVTLRRGIGLCGRLVIRFRPVTVQALGRLGLLQLVKLVERPRGQFTVV